jgi:AcrR family transcriptional regulator
MKSSRTDVAIVRRQQIVEAAVAIITEQGLQNLSLSEIENRAGMSRGQLTYYFPAKEEILLAVFDRLLELMYEGMCAQEGGHASCEPAGPAWIGGLLQALLTGPSKNPEFHCLQYTFLSQISHREDFRLRLARLYEEWRSGMARSLEGHTKASPRALATLIQAILHGLMMQLAADPGAFDRDEMIALCLDLLGSSVKDIVLPPEQQAAKSFENNKVNYKSRTANNTKAAH